MKILLLSFICLFSPLLHGAEPKLPVVLEGKLSSAELRSIVSDAAKLAGETPWALEVYRPHLPGATQSTVVTWFRPHLLAPRVRRMKVLVYRQERPGMPWHRHFDAPEFLYAVSGKGERLPRGVLPDPRRINPIASDGSFTPKEMTDIVDLIRGNPIVPKDQDQRLYWRDPNDPAPPDLPVQSITRHVGDDVEVWTGVLGGEIFHLDKENGRFVITSASDWNE